MMDTCDDGQIQDLENALDHAHAEIERLKVFHMGVAEAVRMVHEQGHGPVYPGEPEEVLEGVRRYVAEVERLKVAAEAAATMNTTNAGEEIERLRKRVAELEVENIRTGTLGMYSEAVNRGYAECEADVVAWLRDDDLHRYEYLAIGVRAGEHRGAAARKGGR